MKGVFASMCGASVDDVNVEIIGASVIITVTILFSSADAASAASNVISTSLKSVKAASSMLGVTVQSVPTVNPEPMTSTSSASTPSDSLTSGESGVGDGGREDTGNAGAKTGIYTVITVVAAVLVAVVLAALFILSRGSKRARTPIGAGAGPVSSSSPVLVRTLSLHRKRPGTDRSPQDPPSPALRRARSYNKTQRALEANESRRALESSRVPDGYPDDQYTIYNSVMADSTSAASAVSRGRPRTSSPSSPEELRT